MTEEKKVGRKPNTPDIKRVIEAISTGRYDEELHGLIAAAEHRRLALRDRVLEQVRRVFGDDYGVIRRGNAENVKVANLFVRKAQEQATPETEEEVIDPLSNLDGVEKQMIQEQSGHNPGRGAIISGLGSSDIAD